MGTIFYDLFVYPIEFLIEFIFTLIYQMIGSLGYSIIGVSLAVSFLVLPLYKRSDAIQEEERKQQEALAPGVNHIRRTFKGDERTMLLSTYYRQNGYRPLYALRGSISLLLQVPFFIAAYHFLSNLSILQGSSFHFLKDLGMPDGMLRIGSLSVNLLPILMTGINILSGAVYTKGFPLKQKLQLYGMALIFLVLLYGSPSGLVLYWTMNNLFSLVKNVFMKRLRHPARTFAWLSALAGGLFAAYMALRGKLYTTEIAVFTVLVALLCLLPGALYLRDRYRGAPRAAGTSEGRTRKSPLPEDAGHTHLLFFLVSVTLAGLLGGMVPLSVIRSSPEEFMPLGEDPLLLVGRTTAIALGIFLIWNGVVYFLKDRTHRASWTRGMFLVLVLFLLNFFTETLGRGKYLSDLMFIYNYNGYPVFQILRNLAVSTALCLILVLAGKRVPVRPLQYITAILLIAVTAYCSVSVVSTKRELHTLFPDGYENPDGDGATPFTFSRTGKNVVVIMLDKAVSRFVPYFLEERPELAQMLSGFVYYPETLSFGVYTNYGMPAIFGGYEYTPAEMNERPELSLMDKHDQALTLMPELFSAEGFEVSVCDPTYAGYKDVPDLSIYDGMKHVQAWNTDGWFVGAYEDMIGAYHRSQTHNMLGYSIQRVLPVALRDWFYDGGNYRGVNRFFKGTMWMTFLKHYSSLEHLSDMTKIVDDGSNRLMLYVNQTTHDEENLRVPEYEPAAFIRNDDAIAQWEIVQEGILRAESGNNAASYEINMAALLLLGRWFDALKAQGVYDNTRIILVADHGKHEESSGRLFSDTAFDEGLDPQEFNPLLLVKDFDADGALTTSAEFMTNADVPALAMEGILKDPVNPYTGNPVNTEPKNGTLVVTDATNSMIGSNGGNTFDTTGFHWFAVTPGDIYDPANWRELSE